MKTNSNALSSPLRGDKGGLSVGVLGAAGYTGGELIRLLLNHPEAEIVFANSESNAGNLVSDVHEGLVGDTDLRFTDAMSFEDVDLVFFCFGHGKSEAFLKEHTIPEGVKIIDLAQDFRIKGDHDYVYGLPEINKAEIQKAQHVANPGCSQAPRVPARSLAPPPTSRGATTTSVFTSLSSTSISPRYDSRWLKYRDT